MQKFLIFDIDHTITTFDHDAGMASLQKYMWDKRDIFDTTLRQRICSFMDRCYAAFLARAKGINLDDIQKIETIIKDASYEIEGLENFTDVHWSRELWIYLSAGGSLSPVAAVEAASSFWKGVALAAVQYDDARKFFDWLNKRPAGYNYKLSPVNRWKTVFVTSSDARLQATRDNLRLLYQAQHSQLMKLGRVKRILPHSPFTFVGDPVSKPHSEFWTPVLQRIVYDPEKDLALMTGDSPRSDLTGLDKFSIVPVLIDRDGKFTPPEVPHAKYIISSLEALQNIMTIEAVNRKEELERRS